MTITRAGTLVSPSDKVRQLLRSGQAIDALRIAKGFRHLGEHKMTIQRGWDAYTTPRFAKSLGRDPDRLLTAALSALGEIYA